ncbi:MAG TPA: proton-conducting transporter membrane subunit, partial [Verrucomicrobiota bacterium]|nr:proton-conducting transporter membrane subunit [Verrucomicrobiota bacterium]
MIAGLILIPFIIGIAALLLKNISKYLLFAGAVFHALLTIFCWFKQPLPMLGGWLGIDSVGMLFLSITSLLFFVVSIYSLSYLEDESEEEKADILGVPSKSLFVACQLFFLSAMTLVITSQHLVVMWIAIEATTLASAPLIFFHRNPRSLEATWKYLLICSVGIALALLGNFFLGISASTNNKQISLVLNDLLSNASQLDPEWLKAAFILIVVGYGTKMGLAPLHTWLPDAHSESPSPVSALLSGALLNCAFLGIFRIYQICNKAGMTTLTSDVLIAFGLFSLAVSAIFILGQNDYKRLLAYSSVEHMGLLALGIGFGASGVFGSMLHTLN